MDFSKTKKAFHSIQCILSVIHLLSLLIDGHEVPLNRDDLRKKYGQAEKTFNDGQSCNRVCDGRPMTCYYEFNIKKYDTMCGLCGDCENGKIKDCFLDGCIPGNGIQRPIMTVNHEMPGPSINVCKDDRIIVDVTNNMAGEEVTMHWHGLHQNDTPWFDGVPMVTQCPIFAGTTFRYVFHARNPGTHYYHAHSGLQRTNGLIGRLNVLDPNDPNASYYDYDLAEHSIVLSDWNNQLAEVNAPGTKIQSSHPESLLINGFGSYFDRNTGNRTFAPMAVFYAERGKKHRFRIDNAASLNCPFELSIHGFNLIVIATDGYSIEPIVVDSFVSSAGERFDIVVDVKNNSNINSTLLNVRALGVCRELKLQEFARIIFVDNITNYTARFEDYEPLKERPSYESFDTPKITLNDPATDCNASEDYCIAELQHKLAPNAIEENLRNEVAKVIPFRFELLYVVERPNHYMTSGDLAKVGLVNGIANTGYVMPALSQDDSGFKYCNADHLPNGCDSVYSICHCPHLVELELCQVYEFLLTDGAPPGAAVGHPIHLHGFGFQVIDMGSLEQYENGKTAFANATHLPVIKDTVQIPSGGFVRIRFRACNPGFWFMHCHYEYHMHAGMTVTIKVGNRSQIPPPPDDFPKCGNYLMPIFAD